MYKRRFPKTRTLVIIRFRDLCISSTWPQIDLASNLSRMRRRSLCCTHSTTQHKQGNPGQCCQHVICTNHCPVAAHMRLRNPPVLYVRRTAVSETFSLSGARCQHHPALVPRRDGCLQIIPCQAVAGAAPNK